VKSVCQALGVARSNVPKAPASCAEAISILDALQARLMVPHPRNCLATAMLWTSLRQPHAAGQRSERRATARRNCGWSIRSPFGTSPSFQCRTKHRCRRPKWAGERRLVETPSASASCSSLSRALTEVQASLGLPTCASPRSDSGSPDPALGVRLSTLARRVSVCGGIGGGRRRPPDRLMSRRAVLDSCRISRPVIPTAHDAPICNEACRASRIG